MIVRDLFFIQGGGDRQVCTAAWALGLFRFAGEGQESLLAAIFAFAGHIFVASVLFQDEIAVQIPVFIVIPGGVLHSVVLILPGHRIADVIMSMGIDGSCGPGLGVRVPYRLVDP